MERLKKNFKKHGLSYTLLKRNEKLCIYGVSGTYTDKILHYEVMFIRIRNDQYGLREVIPSDEDFGRGKPDRHFQKLVEAKEYFDRWTANLMSGVKENIKEVPEYHRRASPYLLDKITIKSEKVRKTVTKINKA